MVLRVTGAPSTGTACIRWPALVAGSMACRLASTPPSIPTPVLLACVQGPTCSCTCACTCACACACACACTCLPGYRGTWTRAKGGSCLNLGRRDQPLRPQPAAASGAAAVETTDPVHVYGYMYMHVCMYVCMRPQTLCTCR